MPRPLLIVCPSCEGWATGTVYSPDSTSDHPVVESESECPTCHGAGEVERDTETQELRPLW